MKQSPAAISAAGETDCRLVLFLYGQASM